MTLQADKAALRDQARQWRSQIDPNIAKVAARDLQRHFLSAVPLAAGQAVSAFWPLKDEIDVRPLMRALDARGHPIGLPVVVDRQSPLVFKAWRPGARLEQSVFGTSVPSPAAATVIPDVLLVPALAIDDAGYRLGYGGGYYDRTIAHLRRSGQAGSEPLAMGFCFECQRVAKVPYGRTDERLDWIVSESGAMRMA